MNLIAGSNCFEWGGYNGNEIGRVSNINDAVSCQRMCQAHSQCGFWTWNRNHKFCKLQTGNYPGKCGNNCIRGPWKCPG